MERIIILFVSFCILPFVCNSVDQASFYGGSYIFVPLKEAKRTTDVHLKFRTKVPNGLLLLAAGITDYCVIYLQSGSLKMKVNLGAGESELSTPNGLILNDFVWHDILIKRDDGNIELYVDNKHSVKKRLASKFFELNIFYGVFIGGKGNFSELFLGHLEYFRGCVSELKYNGMNLLDQARKRIGQVRIHSVTWNCATEFEVDVTREISFVEDEAYVAVSHTPTRTTFRYQMEFKTIIEQCMFLYSTVSKNVDILALEIWKGRIKLTMKYNNVQLNLTHDTIISDGRWHKVLVQIGSSVDLIVDSQPTTSYLIRTSRNRHLEFPDFYSIGGVELEKRSRAMAKGLKTSDTSFKGCLKSIIIDDYKIGLSNVKATDGVRPGCIWKYPCTHNPCAKKSVCLQKGIDSFQCKCEGQLCVNLNYTKEYKVFSNSSLATDLELLSVKALQVIEAENVLITTQNLHLVLDYHKYGIRESGILFYVVEPPGHGTLHVDIWPKKENIFTMLDLSRDKVRYVHDGTESTKDRIIMELELSASDSFILPAYLQGKNRFSLPVVVQTVNDPPILEIPTSSVLRLAQGTEEFLTNKLLQVNDPDTPAQDLIFQLLPQTIEPVGHLERADQPGVSVTTFSQQDINNKQIKFCHHGGTDTNSNIVLQVSDGIETSKIGFLRVSTFAQHLRLQNNTGVVLVHDSFVVITSQNLSVVSNVRNLLSNVKYTIVNQPTFGVIEAERHNKWETVNSFTNTELDQYRIRYRHTKDYPSYDEFKFFASLKTINSTSYIFRMTFTKLNLVKNHLKPIHINSTIEIELTNDDISYRTEPLWTNPSLIMYRIQKTPLYGSLTMYSKNRIENTFTQEDIDSRSVIYKLYHNSFSDFTDSIDLRVSAPGCESMLLNVTFFYHTNEDLGSKVQAIFRPIEVEEGEKTNITLMNMDLTIDGVFNFTYNLIDRPKYGVVHVMNRQSNDYFNYDDLKNGSVIYKHDDSETEIDKFTFLARSSEKINAQYSGEVLIKIQLKNDNTPVRNIDKVFYVVKNGKKLLTGEDLSYIDSDIDTKPSKIIYSCREIPNGAIYRTNNYDDVILEFTQADLNDKIILFKHHGDSYGKIKFWVTDGHFNVNGYLEVEASQPFIKVIKPKKIIVEQGKNLYITGDELHVVTNLNSEENSIVFDVINKPKHGKIVHSSNKQEIKQFTQYDINAAQIMYIHSGISVSFDEVKLQIHCQETSNYVTLSFRILPAIYWKPLILIANHSLYVEESTSISIIKENLEVVQHQIPSKVITYYVIEPPQFGYLDIDSETNVDSKHFTQDAINSNKIRYVQSSANETHDKIVFNVTNGIVWLNHLVLNIIVVPEHLYIGTSELEVYEGSKATLTTANIFVLTNYYKNKVTDFLLIQPPKYGCLITSDNKCNMSNNFSEKNLEDGLLSYSHDNTENFLDEMTVIAIAGQKRSLPATVIFKVHPVNDQIPSMVINTGLVMWEGGIATITNEILSATDNDKPKETLAYNIVGCWWGNVTLKQNPDKSVQSFTQDDIDNNVVLFKHANGSEAKFVFIVSDGLHESKEQPFLIKTKPVHLTLLKLSNPHVFPLHRSYITADDLLTIASDPDRPITYEIITPPTLGRLMMETEIPGNFKIIKSFTQEFINASKIFYEHTHPFAGLYVNDFFIFNVYAHLTPTIYEKNMSIDISVSSGGLDTYILIPKIEVLEGGLTNIQLNLSEVVNFLEGHTGISAPVIHLSASQPAHGNIFLNELSTTKIFTQSEIESGQIKYQHDHSDSESDLVIFSLFLLPGYISLCNVTVQIKIIPINDQPFKLITKAPQITVVQGENCTITQKDLLTEDTDTDPNELLYDIISNPTQGRLIKIQENGVIQDISEISKFSQADVNDNRVIYIHSGSLPQTSFHLRVSDGKFKPEYTVFNIKIVPVIINVTLGIPVYLQQGSNVASLSTDQFNIQTNAAKNRIHLTVTQIPNYGVIYVRDVPSNNFNYSDLQQKSVMYMQTDMSSANDTFKVFVGISNENKNIGSVTEIQVKVQPLMQIGNLSVVSGTKIKFTLNILDANPLAKLTSSNPKYTLIQKPIYGEMRKIIRSSGEKRNVVDDNIKFFTHEEIKSGLIYYVAPKLKDLKIYEEKLVFLLSTSIFQPAVGELRFKITRSYDKSKPNLSEPRDPAGHEGEMHMISSNLNSDYFLVITVITGIIICGIIMLVVIKCRHLNCNDNDKKKAVDTVQLPKPPEQLMSQSPYTKRYIPDNISMPTALTTQIPASMSIPQCKVTLLRPVDSNSELDVHARYPYGADDQAEDWSSYDTSEPTYSTHNTNLMLRKNQYWV